MQFQLLGVFQRLYSDGNMTISRGLLISVVGFLIVFLILGILALFVKAMGGVFDTIAKKKAPVSVPVPAKPVQVSEHADRTEGIPLPSDTSAGELVLTDVTEAEAAVIMAVTSDRTGIPLNRLKFNSIKKLSEDKES